MPLYDFRCKTCETTFEVRRPMAEASDPATCPQGHENAVRLLSVFASAGTSSGAVARAPAPRSGGGCGSDCGCAH
ncbi:MAG: zinc ribbon domain-containing protein [Actinomycetota bacterium]|nr:zinc ribbon domain-containing protein [Actinomycetota bacterium]MDA3019548.1 zinc ribbon domain-containing protein [Actinomycetota bacterium]